MYLCVDVENAACQSVDGRRITDRAKAFVQGRDLNLSLTGVSVYARIGKLITEWILYDLYIGELRCLELG